MYYLYRLPGEFRNWAFATPIEKMTQMIMEPGVVADGPSKENETMSRAATLRSNWVKVQKAAKNIEWDETFSAEPCCFPIATAWGMNYGFIWKQTRFGLTFIASPVKLSYLDEHVDYDAQTDTEVVFRAKQAMRGIEPGAYRATLLSPRLRDSTWRLSAKGNIWRMIDGVVCTIYARNGEYRGMLSDEGTDRKVYTRKFTTEDEGRAYVDRCFNKLWYDHTIGDDDEDY